MKIVYIITLPDLGGAQSHVYELMKYIREIYHVVPVLITGKKGWLTEQTENLQIETHIVPDLVRRISPIHDVKANLAIQKLLKQIKPDIVHCHSSKAGIIGRWVAKQCHIPAVFTAHGWAFTEGVSPKKQKIYRFIEKIAGMWCRKIICVSDYDKNLALREIPEFRDKLLTVHNCIPDTEYRKKWVDYNAVKPLQIVTVARFSPQKKIKETLQILSLALQQNLKIHITFIGDGPQFDESVVYAQKLNVENAVTFLGARTDVEKLLPKFDLFLLLSNWEGFPISIIEAMRAGLPIMASDVGGVKEAVIHGKNGWLIPRDDSTIIDILHDIIANKKQLTQLARGARHLYEQKFTVNKMVQQIMEDVYE
jgi:glycosyltransferase involved in cell wall biosynthesis